MVGEKMEPDARAADTGHSNSHNAWGSTSFRMCKVRCWRCLLGNKIPVCLVQMDMVEKIALLGFGFWGRNQLKNRDMTSL